MKIYLLCLTSFLFVGILGMAQEKYEPTIVVLDPFQYYSDTTLLPEIVKYNFSIDYSPEEEKNIIDSLKKDEHNIGIMNIAEFYYRKQMDFSSHFTLSLNIMLVYMVFGQTEKCIVIPSHDKSNGSKGNLKALAKKHHVRWVVNPLNPHWRKCSAGHSCLSSHPVS